MDIRKGRPQEHMVKYAVLNHNRRSTMGNNKMARSVEGTSGYQERNIG
jgi:hypothetical protein